MHKSLITPSRDFSERLMLKVTKLNQQRQLAYDGLIALLVFSPFLLREVWFLLLARHDYFSVGHLPFSQTILTTYGFFLSAFTAYILLAVGFGAILLYRLGWQKVILTLKSFSQIFAPARFRI